MEARCSKSEEDTMSKRNRILITATGALLAAYTFRRLLSKLARHGVPPLQAVKDAVQFEPMAL